ncbi:zinc finger protein 341-like [Uloborus diversus]|uniref:zinc finger protein 341-like n=1 Tax=Uloborus diversus TaxID=327109 RepID=UPI00240A07C7|nr:zinc finger protein 341-like [Uloborus diversus]
MAQLLFESVNGSALEDSDVFLCGKCKKQFLSIDVFVSHKAECNSSSVSPETDATLASSNVCGIPQNAVVVQNIQIPSAALANYPSSLVLTDTDLLQLSGLDPNVSTGSTSSPSIQIAPNHALLPQSSFTSQTIPATIQHVFQQVTAPNIQQSQTVELSIINDKFISRPVILTSQQANTISGLVFNISNGSQSQTVLCNAPEAEKVVSLPAQPNVPEVSASDCENNTNDKEPSTVNIITEFYSSMVKTKKQSAEGENEEESKKDHKLKCSYCWKSFMKNFDLQQHIRCHTGEKPFQCIVCGRAFAQKSNVKKHMQTHKVWPDGLSRTLPPLPSKNSLLGSEDGELATGSNSSSDESDQGKSSSEVDKNSYACPYCRYIGRSYYKLKSHMKQHDTEKVYKCILSSCGLMFNELDPFLEHTKSHENEMTYRCHECNRNFPSLYDLGSHQFTHSLYPSLRSRTSRRVFRCNLCLNKYSTPAALDHHLATSSHTYSCCWCDKVFPCERYLRRHLQIHSESDTFTCNICTKGFKTESYLKVHMLVHSQDKPYECNVCKAAFNRKDKLKRHLLIHEPVKRYKCPFRTRCGCPKEFNRPDKLKSHILTHSCVKPFTCRTCGKNFTRKANLHEHIKQNHGEENLKSLAEDEQPDDKNCCNASSPNSVEVKLKCNKSFCKKQKDFSHNFRLHRQKKKTLGSQTFKNYGIKRKRGRPKKLLRLEEFNDASKDQDIDSAPEIADDIPTAHIEIIAENGSLDASAELATDISLSPDLNYNNLNFDSAEVESVQSGEQSLHVENMHSTNTDSLLSTDIQSNSNITVYS